MNVICGKKHPIGLADKMLFGHFLEHFHRQIYAGVYDPASEFADEDGFRADVLDALRRIRTPIIRWPGGCYVSAYHWKDGVGANRSAAPTSPHESFAAQIFHGAPFYAGSSRNASRTTKKTP